MSIPVGTLLGPYKILSFIGKGGMGEVYQASDERLGRNVAIKVLPAETGQDTDSLKRLAREAKALATLSHPNIVTIHDVGSAGGISFVVMEYLEETEAFKWLQDAIDVGCLEYRWMMRDPPLENLRGDPKFQHMMAGIKAKVDGMRKRVESNEQ